VWGAALGVAAALAAAIFFLFLRAPGVEVVRVERRDLVPVVRGSGEILPPARVGVHPAVMGKILRVGVAEGQAVRAGDLLAELDGAPYADQAARAQTAVEASAREARAAESSVVAAERKLARAGDLSKKQIASADYLAAARIDLAKARQAQAGAAAALAEARTRLAVAREAMSRTRVAAPISGRVAGLRARPGQTVAEGAEIASIEEVGVFRARILVRAEEGRLVAAGDRASLTSSGSGRPFSGAVLSVAAPNKSGDSAYWTVMIAIPAPVELRSGTPVRARIESAPLRGVLAVPVAALMPSAAVRRAEVFAVVSERARRRAVEVGARGERDAEILSGLAEGDPIVGGPARAVSRLADGDRIVPARRKEK
jgi:RND family efflux transporter MFP subunit